MAEAFDGQSAAHVAGVLDAANPGWWEAADVLSPEYSEEMVALILDRRIYDRKAMPRPYPDEEDILRDELRGLA
jgi:hypothetical protein